MGRNGSQAYKTAKARDYNKQIYYIIRLYGYNKQFNEPLEIHYDFYLPDRRRRDIANYEKVLTDSLVLAGVMTDDHWVHKWVFEKKGYIKGGKVLITIKTMQDKI